MTLMKFQETGGSLTDAHTGLTHSAVGPALEGHMSVPATHPHTCNFVPLRNLPDALLSYLLTERLNREPLGCLGMNTDATMRFSPQDLHYRANRPQCV